MSGYFDAMQRAVREARNRENDAEFRGTLLAVDAQLYRDVTRATGDREFPDDLREKMLGALAVHGCYQPGNLPPNEKAIQRGLVMGYSRAVEELHELFHDLARRRVRTRFGILPDSPAHIAALRNAHDSGA